MATQVYTYFFIYLLVLLQCSESLGTDVVHFSKRLQNSNDGSTSVYTFEWMVQISIADCTDACKSTKACEYINYEVRTHACALIRANDVIQNNIVLVVERKLGYIFGNRSEWTGDAIAECDACSSYGNCTYGNKVCRNSGCGVPHRSGFRGNMFENGSKVLSNCTVITQQTLRKNTLFPSICGDNGEWIDQYNCLPFWNGSYYYVHTDKQTWSDAKINCERMSGHLVDVGSEEENAFVGQLNTEVWIGGNDLEEEGHFQWSDGSAVSEGYKNWHPNMPDNANGNEDCMEIREFHLWNDAHCDVHHRSICEFEFDTK